MSAVRTVSYVNSANASLARLLRRFCLSFLLFLLIVFICAPSFASDPDATSRYRHMAEQIRATFDKALPTFSSYVQRHYAMRMYRATGDTAYVPWLVNHAKYAIAKVQIDVDSLNNPHYFARRIAEEAETFERDTRKNRLRRAMFKKWDEELVYLELLSQLNWLADYGLDSSTVGPLMARARAKISQHDLSKFLLDPDVIRVYAAKAVNFVYFLEHLGIADIRKEYMEVFRDVFDRMPDNRLDEHRYSDKIYGLTHIILAASQYYQQPVDSAEYGWVTDRLEARIDKILKETSSDIIVEVALCFCLTGQENHPIVERCKKVLLKSFDSKKGMILSETGNKDLSQGEHRNVLAFMLFARHDTLYPGPLLTRYF
ncbi:MAG: DUF3541 domain-containing protein [candidate division Zixibacteria bacterium]|nr:DUF3541 domain-containing protein [candidate division Zixibacteria bacterium]